MCYLCIDCARPSPLFAHHPSLSSPCRAPLGTKPATVPSAFPANGRRRRNEFFDIFGIPRKSVAVFEHAVAKARGTHGFLDLFWPGVLLVEHKSAGAPFGKAESQAFAYLGELARQGRHDKLPQKTAVVQEMRESTQPLILKAVPGVPRKKPLSSIPKAR